MHFLPDVYIPCDKCFGNRYNKETLEVTYKGLNISEVLELSIKESIEYFKNIPKICKKLQMLDEVGLGYLKWVNLQQPYPEEKPKVKLATELCKRSTGQPILDEPTTGLHFEDVRKLLEVLERLRDEGNTVIVIEHNLDMIKRADHILDLGPGGGVHGGKLVISGTPEKVAECKDSYTGLYLKELL